MRDGDTGAGVTSLRRVSLAGLPDETYIMEDPALERVLFDRALVGPEFARVCLEASTHFCRLLAARLDVPDIAELLILNGGRYYGLATAYERVIGRSLPVDELKATRRQGPDGTGAWSAEISYRRYRHRPRTLLVGDTVATGVSAQVALEDYFAHHTPDELLFFTICGAIAGARVIAAACAAHNVRLTLVFGLAAFGLADNGTDLPFLHPDTVAAPRHLERARRVYGGQPVCAIGDWGERGEDPPAYLAKWEQEKRRFGLG